MLRLRNDRPVRACRVTRMLRSLGALAAALAAPALWIAALLTTTAPALGAEKYILTPPESPMPRINGAKVFGVRPGHPFLYTVAATGERPMTFSAEGLPAGLALDEKTGRITGVIADQAPKTYTATLKAKNARGTAEREFRICVGEAIALTPPMGWNSWNCWAATVSAERVLASAQAMVDKGLINHGWTYVNTDDAWQAARRGGPFMALQGNERFPDMKALCDNIHGLGLKAGIYSTPWTVSYARYLGGSSDDKTGESPLTAAERDAQKRLGKYSFAENDAQQWAAWGFDYMKYDWKPNTVREVDTMAAALRNSGRDIVLSLSNSAPYELAEHWKDNAQAWRTTLDIRDEWAGHPQHLGLMQIAALHEKWVPYTGPGHWSDPDMLVVGKVGWHDELRDTHLTPDEQYSHISLWSLWSAPLLIGCPIDKLDDFTLSLLTNDEVLEINQDPLGRQAYIVQRDGDGFIYAKPLENGDFAIGFFNFGPKPADMRLRIRNLNSWDKFSVRDLWRQKNLDDAVNYLNAPEVPSHGVVLMRLHTIAANAGTDGAVGGPDQPLTPMKKSKK